MFKWTTEQPTEPGWYWFRKTGPQKFSMQPHIVKVRKCEGQLCIMNWRIPDAHTQWSGPIPVPKTIRRRNLETALRTMKKNRKRLEE